MIQRSQHLGFPLESRETVRVASHVLWQDFDSHRAFQVGVGCVVDLPHAALTDLGGNYVGPEAGAERQ